MLKSDGASGIVRRAFPTIRTPGRDWRRAGAGVRLFFFTFVAEWVAGETRRPDGWITINTKI